MSHVIMIVHVSHQAIKVVLLGACGDVSKACPFFFDAEKKLGIWLCLIIRRLLCLIKYIWVFDSVHREEMDKVESDEAQRLYRTKYERKDFVR